MIRKDPVTHMLIVGAYFEGELTFACDSFLENSYSYVFFLIDFSSLIALLGPRSLEGPIKSLLSVHLLSVCPSVRHFSQEWLFSFFSDFLHDGRYVEYLKIDRALFSKIHFAQIWEKRSQNGPKIRILGFFEKFCH